MRVDRSDVMAEQSSVTEQTSQNLNLESQRTKSNANELVPLKKPAASIDHGAVRLQIHGRLAGALLTSSLERPSLRQSNVAKDGINSDNDSNLLPKRSLFKIEVDLPS